MTYVYAKSEEGSIGYRESVHFIKYDTEQNFHNAVRVYHMDLPAAEDYINVENTVQRKNSSGTYVNVGRHYFHMEYEGQTLEHNFKLTSGTADTRTIWGNLTKNSFLNGRFYINNGLI